MIRVQELNGKHLCASYFEITHSSISISICVIIYNSLIIESHTKAVIPSFPCEADLPKRV